MSLIICVLVSCCILLTRFSIHCALPSFLPLLQLLSSHFTINRSNLLQINHFLKLIRLQIISVHFHFPKCFSRCLHQNFMQLFHFQWKHFPVPTCLSHVYVAEHCISLYCQSITGGLCLHCGNSETLLINAASTTLQIQSQPY